MAAGYSELYVSIGYLGSKPDSTRLNRGKEILVVICVRYDDVVEVYSVWDAKLQGPARLRL